MRYLLLTACLIASCAAALAAPAAKLPEFGFEDGPEGWISISPAGTVGTAATPKHVRTGQLALEFNYEAKKDTPGQLPVLAVPLTGIEGMRSLRLDVRTDGPTLLMVALGEEGGARYEYITATPNDAWQHLEIDRSEFIKSDDTQDADGRLDPDQVRNLAVADTRAVLTTMDNAFIKMLGERPGKHSFWLDNVAFSAEPAIPPAPAGQVIVDDFRRENMHWISLAGVALQVGPAPAGAEGRALRLDYPIGPGKLPAIIRPFAPGQLAGAKKITFRAAAKASTTLAIGLEETGGAKYTAVVPLPAGTTPQPYTVNVSDFKLNDDSQDADGRLDMDQVKMITFLDAAGLQGAPDGSNILWLQDIRAIAGGGMISR